MKDKEIELLPILQRIDSLNKDVKLLKIELKGVEDKSL